MCAVRLEGVKGREKEREGKGDGGCWRKIGMQGGGTYVLENYQRDNCNEVHSLEMKRNVSQFQKTKLKQMKNNNKKKQNNKLLNYLEL